MEQDILIEAGDIEGGSDQKASVENIIHLLFDDQHAIASNYDSNVKKEEIVLSILQLYKLPRRRCPPCGRLSDLLQTHLSNIKSTLRSRRNLIVWKVIMSIMCNITNSAVSLTNKFDKPIDSFNNSESVRRISDYIHDKAANVSYEEIAKKIDLLTVEEVIEIQQESMPGFIVSNKSSNEWKNIIKELEQHLGQIIKYILDDNKSSLINKINELTNNKYNENDINIAIRIIHFACYSVCFSDIYEHVIRSANICIVYVDCTVDGNIMHAVNHNLAVEAVPYAALLLWSNEGNRSKIIVENVLEDTGLYGGGSAAAIKSLTEVLEVGYVCALQSTCYNYLTTLLK